MADCQDLADCFAYHLLLRTITHYCACMTYRIHPEGLAKCMSTAPMSKKQLAASVGISVQYTTDICAGRRTLTRNPELRRKIAAALDVPQSWIEVAA